MKIAAIGCSFTNYMWPTYADILQADRYGLSGIGNERIFYILCHLYKTEQLHLYDAIVLQWTSPGRFDYLKKDGWTYNDGNIAFSEENKHIWKKIKEWYNEDFEYEKTENYIVSTRAICEKIGIKQFHMSMVHLDDFVDQPNLNRKYPGRYRFKSAPWSKQPFLDGHPDIPGHIEIAKHVANNFDTTVDQLMIDKCTKFHKKIMKGMDFLDVEKMYDSNFPYRHITTGS